ncbi:MAG: class I SAM-dependent methyltransferase [Tidjanibacter sp.]|nr:class I SAM-dependent methyltransferase [Tidjanibacter sp.]
MKGVPQTAERVSQRDASDNYVFQRSLLAYLYAAERVQGKVLEIGTGSGYGVEIIAPHAERFVTIDKHAPAEELLEGYPNVEFRQMCVPPLEGIESESVDCVISFQVIEHIKRDKEFVREVHRVLRKGGVFIVSTPNRPMSLTRNPWHVREYSPEEFSALFDGEFESVEALGVEGNEKVWEYYEKNRQGVERITRFDPLDFQHRLPRWVLRIPYDLLNRLNRRRLLRKNNDLTVGITTSDYAVVPVHERCFDLLYIAKK